MSSREESEEGEAILSPSDRELLQQIGYTFLHQLGEGSYAKVYYGVYRGSGTGPSTANSSSTDEGRPFACKITDVKRAPREFVNKFLPRELDIISKISHPDIIHVSSIYLRTDKYFVFMRYAEKGDLLDYILENGETEESLAKHWTAQLTTGLEYLHSLEIAHRDIKCENVLVTRNNNVKLGDFGFARFVVNRHGKQMKSKTYCGSCAYAAPEILCGRPYAPKGSDVWALGVVVFVMLNRSMPFNDNSPRQLLNLQLEKKWKFRSKVAAQLSFQALQAVSRMLEPQLEDRAKLCELRAAGGWLGPEMTSEERDALQVGLNLKQSILPQAQMAHRASSAKMLETGSIMDPPSV